MTGSDGSIALMGGDGEGDEVSLTTGPKSGFTPGSNIHSVLQNFPCQNVVCESYLC